MNQESFTLRLTQRLTLAVTFCMLIALVFVHNPTSGYELEAGRGPSFSEPCSSSVRDYLRKSYEDEAAKSPTNATTRSQIEAKVNECTNSFTYAEYRPFSEWRSNQPLVYWLGSVPNLLLCLVAVLLMSGAIFWAVRVPASRLHVAQGQGDVKRDA